MGVSLSGESKAVQHSKIVDWQTKCVNNKGKVIVLTVAEVIYYSQCVVYPVKGNLQARTSGENINYAHHWWQHWRELISGCSACGPNMETSQLYLAKMTRKPHKTVF